MTPVHAQKKLTKTWEGNAVKFLEVKVPWANTITLIASKTYTSINAIHTSEGEYQEGVSLRFQENGTQLIIEELLTPGFNNHLDKLSAHKHIASTLVLHLPPHLEVKVYAQDAVLSSKGALETLDATLQSGKVEVFEGIRKGNIRTASADVIIKDASLSVQATSRSGKVLLQKKHNATPTLKVETLSADIIQH